MSKVTTKVDLSVFEELAEALGYDSSNLRDLVYDASTEEEGLWSKNFDYPERNGRSWDDPAYKEEYAKYQEESEADTNKILKDFDYELLDHFSSGEGEGESCYGVFYFIYLIFPRKYHITIFRTAFTSAADLKYDLAFLGYGRNPEHAEVELTYNYGVDKYELGTAFGHLAIGVEDVAATCAQVREKASALGGAITREPGPVKGGTSVIAEIDTST